MPLIIVLIPKILLSSFINSAANCGHLSNNTVSGKPWSFQTWSLNNVARPLVEVSVVIGIICACFVWWQHKSIITLSFRESSNKVDSDIFPRHRCSFIWPKLSSWFLRKRFHPLAMITSSNISFDLVGDNWPQIIVRTHNYQTKSQASQAHSWTRKE